MIKPNFKEQLIVFGEASKLIEVSDFLRQNWVRSNVLIFDKKAINSLELENLELLENQSSVIYIEEEYKSDFGIKAAFLEKMISAKANVFTLALQNWKKNDFNFKEFQLQDLYKTERIAPGKFQQKNKKLLITGGAGFIGAALVKYYSDSFSEIIIVDQAETALFYLKEELEALYPNAKMQCLLADVTNRERMTAIFEEFQPEIVIHAAAYKHVALLENELEEVIKNNIAGTYIIFYLAETYKAEQCILLSTDKAVEPKSVMGKSKCWAEKLCFWFSNLDGMTDFKTIRFGNVLGSTGSVLPIWKRQLRWKNAIMMTKPEAYRYFFTLQEVFGLTDFILANRKSGSVFTIFNEYPVALKTLANLFLYHQSGKIMLTGLKGGEKEREQLIAKDETPIHQQSFLIVNSTKIKDDFPEQLHLLLSDKMLIQDKQSIFDNYQV